LLADSQNQQQIFRGMLDDNIAQTMANGGGPNDLSTMLYKQLAGSRAYAMQNTGKSAPVSVGGSR
jgi:Rod binding domain-containing protein